MFWWVACPCYLPESSLLSLVAFFVGEKLGRRRMIWLAMAIVVIGTSLQTSAFNVGHLVVGRIVTGMGTGLKTSTVPMYQSELCPPTSRGRLVSAEVCFVGVGIVFAYWFNFVSVSCRGPTFGLTRLGHELR